MELDQIEKLLQKCDLQDLRRIDDLLTSLIEKGYSREAEVHEKEKETNQMRAEDRFETNLLGTIARVTDIKPGEPREYSATIKDISRNGMCLQVNSNFIPSRIIEITFGSPNGKIKKCCLEVVRMRRMENQNGLWLEVGCRGIADEKVRKLRVKEERVSRMRNKLYKHSGILIQVVGTSDDLEKKLAGELRAKRYSIHRIDNITQAMQSAGRTAAQLAIFCHGSQLCMDSDALAEIKRKPPTLATLAIVEKKEHSPGLLEAGIDECLSVENVNEYLVYAIERTIVSHASRTGAHGRQQSGLALIASSDSVRINMVSYQLEECGYDFAVADNVDQLGSLAAEVFDLAFIDFDVRQPDEFKKMRELCRHRHVIAMCEDISHGRQAMVNGAADYMCIPPGKDDIRMFLENAAMNPQKV